ncbi:MAG: cobyric acid synthase [Spirochaetia bacterium]|nr:cobyric acid synthase [Spirochaetia bacterium]
MPLNSRKDKVTPALMVQGTGSNVGKSLLAAAFCRIFTDDGINTAPFKAQNMSLNSFVTANNEEVSRSIALQAKACRKDVHVNMNPVLLKPNSDTSSQCILLGRPYNEWSSKDFLRSKEKFWQTIKNSYNKISSENNLIILEGAGSPGEINLKKNDMVNMKMAKHARAKVLLAGDIDKGGVFASFIGHIHVMEKWERNLIAGFLINKFRGDASLLTSAIKKTKAYTSVPTLGIVPYINNLNLPEEDGMSVYQKKSSRKNKIHIAVISYPYMSNFTDFDAFYIEPDVEVFFTRKPNDLMKADVIVLPGSKNLRADVKWLFQHNLAEIILQLANQKKEVVGICGGLQILGETIFDPGKVESLQEHTKALGLMNIKTEFKTDKILKRTTTIHKESSFEVTGYEIHHGISKAENVSSLFKQNSSLGYKNNEKNIWGTYLHGIFDSDLFRHWWLNKKRKEKGFALSLKINKYDIEPEINKLAEVVRENVNMKEIYAILNI